MNSDIPPSSAVRFRPAPPDTSTEEKSGSAVESVTKGALSPVNSVITGVELIAAERARQLTEGYSNEGDDRLTGGELGMAAAAYALPPTQRHEPLPWMWPWSGMVWKPSPCRVRELAKAGALIAAEIDRVMREEQR